METTLTYVMYVLLAQALLVYGAITVAVVRVILREIRATRGYQPE